MAVLYRLIDKMKLQIGNTLAFSLLLCLARLPVGIADDGEDGVSEFTDGKYSSEVNIISERCVEPGNSTTVIFNVTNFKDSDRNVTFDGTAVFPGKTVVTPPVVVLPGESRGVELEYVSDQGADEDDSVFNVRGTLRVNVTDVLGGNELTQYETVRYANDCTLEPEPTPSPSNAGQSFGPKMLLPGVMMAVLMFSNIVA